MPIRKATGALSAALAWALCADAAPTSDSHTIEQIVPGSPFHGVHGLTFDRNDVLYAGSVVGQRVYRVDTATGHAEAVVDPPHGMADDLVFLIGGVEGGAKQHDVLLNPSGDFRHAALAVGQLELVLSHHAADFEFVKVVERDGLLLILTQRQITHAQQVGFADRFAGDSERDVRQRAIVRIDKLDREVFGWLGPGFCQNE